MALVRELFELHGFFVRQGAKENIDYLRTKGGDAILPF
jgi:hypothetical protein